MLLQVKKVSNFSLVLMLIQFLDVHAWHNIENRRKFFESYAKENGFDPNSAKAWLLQSKQKILEAKVCVTIFLYKVSSSCDVLLIREHGECYIIITRACGRLFEISFLILYSENKFLIVRRFFSFALLT